MSIKVAHYNLAQMQLRRNSQKQAEEIAKLRKALSYYADEKHYEGYCAGYFASDITEDEGHIAREALK